jgi:hypothetical protein
MFAAAAATILIPAAATAQNESNAARRLATANEVTIEVMSIPERSIPQDLLNRAECIVIVPGMKKGAFIIGGKFGRGFVSCRNEGQRGMVGARAVRVEGGSVGFQIGGAETDVLCCDEPARRGEDVPQQVHARGRRFGSGGSGGARHQRTDRRVHERSDPHVVAPARRVRGYLAHRSHASARSRSERELYGAITKTPTSWREK